MSLISIDVNEELLQEANEVLEESGVDFTTVTRMLLKRVVREQSIAFLLTSAIISNEGAKNMKEAQGYSKIRSDDGYISDEEVKVSFSNFTEEKENMTKNMAVRLIRSKGYNVARNITFASKNRGAYNYWANPKFFLLKEDWSLILNDWIGKKVYLFSIPANSIQQFELTPRADKPYIIDLQIMYRDTTFTDNRSGFSFAKYLAVEISY